MKNTTEIRNKNGDVIRRRVQEMNTKPSKTQQQFLAETDANQIMKKYNKSLYLEAFNTDPSMYSNLASKKDFFESQQILTQAHQAFQMLPSEVRKKFENDPAKMVAFVHDQKN